MKKTEELTRAELLSLLSAHIDQRPGLEFANYGDVSAYRRDSREITADGHDARRLLAAVAWRDSITAEDIRKALQGSGRLTLDDRGRLYYCTGQYFPTEYRPAASRVLAGLLWDYWRDQCTPEDASIPKGYKRLTPGEFIRKKARAELGQRIAHHYFR